MTSSAAWLTPTMMRRRTTWGLSWRRVVVQVEHHPQHPPHHCQHHHYCQHHHIILSILGDVCHLPCLVQCPPTLLPFQHLTYVCRITFVILNPFTNLSLKSCPSSAWDCSSSSSTNSLSTDLPSLQSLLIGPGLLPGLTQDLVHISWSQPKYPIS